MSVYGLVTQMLEESYAARNTPHMDKKLAGMASSKGRGAPLKRQTAAKYNEMRSRSDAFDAANVANAQAAKQAYMNQQTLGNRATGTANLAGEAISNAAKNAAWQAQLAGKYGMASPAGQAVQNAYNGGVRAAEAGKAATKAAYGNALDNANAQKIAAKAAYNNAAKQANAFANSRAGAGLGGGALGLGLGASAMGLAGLAQSGAFDDTIDQASQFWGNLGNDAMDALNY